MSLLNILPEPIFTHKWKKKNEIDGNVEEIKDDEDNYFSKENTVSTVTSGPPSYGMRQGFVPRSQKDYGDGGAFPEIRMKQYPLGMGLNKEEYGLMKNFSVAPLQVGKNGEIKYDSVIRQNTRKSKTVFSTPEDSRELVLRKSEVGKDPLSKPSREEALELTEETRRALEAALEGKIQSKNPRQTVEETTDPGEPTYFRFTAANQTPLHNSGARTRIVRMQQMPVDPLEPPKFQFRKQPQRAPSPPAPVLRSPPRKLSKEEAAAWKIPPCVSNWKNIKGFTIPLDKRLAADGRGYESFTINSKFSSLSTALYEAENLARENVRLRGEQMKKIAQQKRQQKEQELEEKARSAIGIHERVTKGSEQDEANSTNNLQRDVESVRREIEEYSKVNERNRDQPSVPVKRNEEMIRDKPRYERNKETENKSLGSDVTERKTEKPESSETKEEAKARMAREELRRDRLRERRRELRMEERKKKRGYGDREKERDISERIALGQNVGFAGEVMYDSRLFNTVSGVEAGLEDDDMYNVYDKPLFNSVSSTIYKPRDFDREDDNNEGGDRKRQRKDRGRENKPIEFVEEPKPAMANKKMSPASPVARDLPRETESHTRNNANATVEENGLGKGKDKTSSPLHTEKRRRHRESRRREERRENGHRVRHRHENRRRSHHRDHSKEGSRRHRRRHRKD